MSKTYPPFSIPKKGSWKIKERFLGFIKKTPDGCWEWLGCICARNYPRFWVRGRSAHLAHRVSYALFKGPIRSGKVIDHKCNNTLCVNPEHLQATTQSANIKAIHRRKEKASP